MSLFTRLSWLIRASFVCVDGVKCLRLHGCFFFDRSEIFDRYRERQTTVQGLSKELSTNVRCRHPVSALSSLKKGILTFCSNWPRVDGTHTQDAIQTQPEDEKCVERSTDSGQVIAITTMRLHWTALLLNSVPGDKRMTKKEHD